ncbi:hypothetical protein [Mycoplasmopsis cynos]|uniref:Uncharacterized protein n=1 Tax=Mycoplasmopsis cynos TaxID=171284 RepID=A0A449AH66_9BACT|nr:hypothetical protein [Mycoplasmopsis cynos]VEU64345.1 Uncharacterised protein [Mycoplasmopsis cynos]
MKKEIHYYIFEDDDFKEILSQELDHISNEYIFIYFSNSIHY